VSHPVVAVRRLALDGHGFPLEAERISTVRTDANVANGMALDRDGRVVVCEQGSPTRPAAITVEGRPLVRGMGRCPLNSPNDVVVKSDGTIWFTDPSYGWLQGFRPPPRLAGAPPARSRRGRGIAALPRPGSRVRRGESIPGPGPGSVAQAWLAGRQAGCIGTPATRTPSPASGAPQAAQVSPRAPGDISWARLRINSSSRCASSQERRALSGRDRARMSGFGLRRSGSEARGWELEVLTQNGDRQTPL
jgi:hypothetical protein